jgi:hypothetical protein
LPGVQVANIQKEINLIREGKATDPIGRPLTPEAAEARIKELQGAQAQSQQKLMETQAESAQYQKRPTIQALGELRLHDKHLMHFRLILWVLWLACL